MAGRIDIANQVLAVIAHGLDMRDARFNETHPQIIFGLVVVALEIFAESANVDVKDGGIQTVAAVLFG